MRLRDLHPRRFFLETWSEIDRESASWRLSEEGRRGARSDALLALYIFAVVAVSLILQEYFGGPRTFFAIVDFVDGPLSEEAHPFLWSLVGWLAPDDGSTLYGALRRGGYMELWNLGYWAVWRVLGFLVLPLIAVAVHPRLSFGDLGLSFEGMRSHIWVYGALFLPVLAAVVAVSFTEDFSSYYPFYRDAHRSAFDFLAWEALYVAQFFSLELFFRGFMLQPLRRYIGSPAILAMVVPYVMIHFGKPFAECFAAIVAGVVLGTLAMRTRSIWSGFLIHVSVAVSMDLAAIWQVHWRW